MDLKFTRQKAQARSSKIPQTRPPWWCFQ